MAKMTVNRDICKGCGLCVEVCPKKIVFLDKSVLNGKGYHPATSTNMFLRKIYGSFIRNSQIYRKSVSYTHLIC